MSKEFPRGVEVITGAIIRNAEGKLFLAKSPKWDNQWVIPGGHVEPGETMFACAEREVKEETGLAAKAVKLIRVAELINLPNFHRPAHMISMVILLEVTGGEVKLDGVEMVEHRWVTVEEALDIVVDGTIKEAFESYSQKTEV
jgi:nucleoside triphosphatase